MTWSWFWGSSLQPAFALPPLREGGTPSQWAVGSPGRVTWDGEKTVLGPACTRGPSSHTPCLAVRGAWSCWTAWSPCSASCGGGHYQRTRSCTSPAPSPGEDICLGLHTEEALCATQACPGTEYVWQDLGSNCGACPSPL